MKNDATMERLILPLLAFVLILATSCGGNSENDIDGDTEYREFSSAGEQGAGSEQFRSDDSGMLSNTGNENVTMHPVMDQKTGMVMYQMPLPASWRISPTASGDEPSIVGPGGVKVFYRNGGSYTYSNDPNTQRSYQQAGQQMRAPMEIGAYIQQDLVPGMAQKGRKLVKQIPLPQIAARNKAYSAKLIKAMPSQQHDLAMGTEWLNNEGELLFMIVNMTINQGQNDVYWYASLQALTADKSTYENAKMALINGLVNTQDNPQQIAAYNANEEQKANQSWAQHNGRMQQNQAAFDQQQATHRSTWDAVNNASMNAYNDRNASQDRMQHQTINSIYEENTVTNPTNGQNYQVDAGSDQYWMNSNGEYIPSNDGTYNPNADQNVNNQTWEQAVPEP